MKWRCKSSGWQRFAKRLILGGCGIGLTSGIHAQMIVYEGFEAYAGGVQVETGTNGTSGTGLDGGSGWGGPYDVQNGIKSLVFIDDRTVNPVVYQNGAITVKGGARALRLSATANGSYAIRRPLAAALAAGGTVYFSFLFRTANSSPLANQDFLQVGFDNNPNPASGTPRVSVGTNTISTTFPPNQPFRFFARSSAATASSMFDNTTDIQGSTTYLLVGKISRTGDATSLFSITSVTSDLNGLILEWRSGPGRRYHVQWSDDFVTWNVLNDGGVPVVLDASSGSRTSFAFVPTTTAERRFYRIEALP